MRTVCFQLCAEAGPSFTWIKVNASEGSATGFKKKKKKNRWWDASFVPVALQRRLELAGLQGHLLTRGGVGWSGGRRP